jgi:hypothetical protein
MLQTKPKRGRQVAAPFLSAVGTLKALSSRNHPETRIAESEYRLRSQNLWCGEPLSAPSFY